MEPELAFVLVDTADDSVVGYTAGAANTTKFYDLMLTKWLPKLRSTYTTPPDPSTKATWYVC